MSVVACRVYDNRIEIASDSITVRGWSQTKGENKHGKLFQSNGMTIGGVGLAKDTSLLRLFCSTRKPESNKESDIITFFNEFATWKKKQTDSFDISNNVYIFIYQGKAYQFQDFFVNEIYKYMAIGAGFDFANAAMYLGHGVEKAVEVACELSIYCEKPINKFVINK